MNSTQPIRRDTDFNLPSKQWEEILTEAERQKESEQDIDRASYLKRIMSLITTYLPEIRKYTHYEISITYDLVDTFKELQTTIQ